MMSISYVMYLRINFYISKNGAVHFPLTDFSLIQEQDKSSDIEQQPPFGDCTLSNTILWKYKQTYLIRRPKCHINTNYGTNPVDEMDVKHANHITVYLLNSVNHIVS